MSSEQSYASMATSGIETSASPSNEPGQRLTAIRESHERLAETIRDQQNALRAARSMVFGRAD